MEENRSVVMICERTTKHHGAHGIDRALHDFKTPPAVVVGLASLRGRLDFLA